MTLTRAQASELQRIIAERHAAFESALREDVERSREETFAEVAGAVHDTADEAAADLIADLDQAEVGRDLQELRDLEAAQARIANCTYGICTDCGIDIAYDRLLAYPTAKRCIDCQERREKASRRKIAKA